MTPYQSLQGVRHSPLVAVDYALSNNGTLIYSPQSGAGGYDLVWVDREGQENLLTEEPRPFTHIRLSPDGQQVVLDMTGDIWIYDVEPRHPYSSNHRWREHSSCLDTGRYAGYF